MIVSHKRQFVYVGPPKTASTSLHWWLSQPSLCDSRWDCDYDHQHDTQVPHEAAGYFRLASIRAPLDRAVSLWQHKVVDCGNLGVEPITFAEFLAWLPASNWFYARRQADYLHGFWPDAIVRFDRLEADLLALPFVAGVPREELEPLPHLNATTHTESSLYYSPWLTKSAQAYFAEDIELWQRVNEMSGSIHL